MSRVYYTHSTRLFLTNNIMYFRTWSTPGSSTLVKWSSFWNHPPSMTNFTQLYQKSWRRTFYFHEDKEQIHTIHQKWSCFVTRWNKCFNFIIVFTLSCHITMSKNLPSVDYTFLYIIINKSIWICITNSPAICCD